jgi:hypothetical protein
MRSPSSDSPKSNRPGDVILSRAASTLAYQSLIAPSLDCTAPVAWSMAGGGIASQQPAITATIVLGRLGIKASFDVPCVLRSSNCPRATTAIRSPNYRSERHDTAAQGKKAPTRWS